MRDYHEMHIKDNKPVALITGSARRVGAVIAKTLHSAGFSVIIHYRHSKSEAIVLRDSLNAIRENSAAIAQADLDDPNTYQTLITHAHNQWNRLDLLVNNASTFTPTPIGNIDFATWDRLLNSNLKAPFFLSQTAMPFLKKNNGSIINITDVHTEQSMKRYPVYSIAKAGLRMLTKALALECAPVRVNAVAPGNVIWPEHENTLSDAEKQHILSKTLLKRQITPEEIAQAVLFLATQSAITAQTIVVDGGRIV